MRALVLGANGWIGGMLKNALEKTEDVEYVYTSERHVDSESSIENEIVSLNPSHVFCCIGRTSGYIQKFRINTIAYLEYPGKLIDNLNDNLVAPLSIARVCDKYGIHMTYIGDGCVFDNTDGGHNDTPNSFSSSYAIVKGVTDRLLREFPRVLIARIRFPVTNCDISKDYINKLIYYEKVYSSPTSLTVLDELLPVLVDMVKRNITGCINLVNPGQVTQDDILKLYKDKIDPNLKWTNITKAERDASSIVYKSNAVLDTKELMLMYPGVRDVNCALETILDERKCLLGL